jgi:hypothetical protein
VQDNLIVHANIFSKRSCNPKNLLLILALFLYRVIFLHQYNDISAIKMQNDPAILKSIINPGFISLSHYIPSPI